MYAILGFLVFSVLAGYYVWVRPPLGIHQNPFNHHNVESKVIDTTWSEYLLDCGGEQVIENFVHTKLVFNDKYENNVITWNGFFAEVKKKEGPLDFIFNNEHYMSILVKMSPSESVMFADLVLSVSSKMYN